MSNTRLFYLPESNAEMSDTGGVFNGVTNVDGPGPYVDVVFNVVGSVVNMEAGEPELLGSTALLGTVELPYLKSKN
jgi:hypothetical protein